MSMMNDDPLLWPRRRLLASLLGFAALAASGVPARAAPRAAALTPQDQDDLKRVQEYLNGIKTLQSRFQQFAQDGTVPPAPIHLQPPPHLRIVSPHPTPTLIL